MNADVKFPETIVLLDAGNSRLKYCLVRQDALDRVHQVELSAKADMVARAIEISATGSVSNSELASFESEYQCSASLKALVRMVARPESLVLLASVAQVQVRAGLGRLQKRCASQFREVKVQAASGRLKMTYDNIETLGVDRWLAMLAGTWRQDGGFCVIDCGSAITADFVATDGCHEGGLIAPGLETILASLELADSLKSAIGSIKSAPAGQLASIGSNQTTQQKSGFWLGRSSASCIALGVRRMVGDFVCGVVHQIEERSPSPLLLITGGGWWELADRVTVDYRYVERLVFEGMLISWISELYTEPFSA